MPIKKIKHPDLGTLAFGRKRPRTRFPHLSIKNYLEIGLPRAPEAVTYTQAALPSLKRMYKNDVLGCCVEAAECHLEGVLTGNADGTPRLYTDPQVIQIYSEQGGYVPGKPSTDNGTDLQTALSMWEQNGLLGKNKIAGVLGVNAGNVQEIKTTLYLFGNLIFGMELPDEWISPPPADSGFTWDVAGDPDPENGHAFIGTAYNAQARNTVTIATWGMRGVITFAAIEKYASAAVSGELYTVLSQDAISKAKQKAPNGFNWAQLVADFQAIGGVIS